MGWHKNCHNNLLDMHILKTHNSCRNKKGITLIELMIVVVIIGILAAIAIPRFSATGVKTRQSEAKQVLKQAFTLLMAYRQEYTTFDCGTGAIGFSSPATRKYKYSFTELSGNYFKVIASTQTNLDKDAMGDIWYIDIVGGKPIVYVDDATTQF